MEKRFQVFVSSTYRDLMDERKEVIQALLELDCIPAGMEMFLAANEDQWSLIERVIDDCDYYLVIVGGRYGSISQDGLSYTEREYDYALAKGIPILGFVHEAPSSIPASHVDLDPAAAAKLDLFRSKVMKKPVRTYKSSDQLGSVVSRSLIKLIKAEPGEGWVRARFALTPEVTEELSRLRTKVAESELKQAQKELASFSEFEDLAHGDDEIQVRYSVKFSLHDGGDTDRVRTFTWNELLVLIGPQMLDEASEISVITRINNRILSEIKHEPAIARWGNVSVAISRSDWDTIKMQFRALGLMEKGTKKRGLADRNTYWKLSPRGDELLVRLMAIKRQAPSGS